MHLFNGSSVSAAQISGEASIFNALETMERTGFNAVLISQPDGTLLGIATDGDIRRAILGGAALEAQLLPFANLKPTTCHVSESRSAALDVMLSRGLAQLPVIDDRGILVGLHTLRDTFGSPNRTNSVFILAGGRGSRLGRMTEGSPKPMIRVAGRPILERLVDHFVGYGLTNITISVSYLGDTIRQHFGDGSDFGCRITYQEESPDRPRGTGGPLLDFVHTHSSEEAPIVVANGDLVTSVNLGALITEHESFRADFSLVVQTYAQEVAFGVVHQESDGWVHAIEEKPLMQLPVNAGIYVANPSVVRTFRSSESISMTDLISECLRLGYRVHAFESEAEWVDVGSPRSLARARGLVDFE